MTFPAEALPDGNPLFAHHYIYPLLLALIPTARVWSRNRTKDPWLVLLAIVMGLFGFISAWQTDPTLGATLSGAALALGLLALLRPMWADEWPQYHRFSIAVLFLLALDDWASHALGLWTPADHLFRVLPLWQVGVIVLASIVVGHVSIRWLASITQPTSRQ